MKRLFLICLSIILLLAFAGCSSNVDSSTDPAITSMNTASPNHSNSGINTGNTTASSISGEDTENKINRDDTYQSKQDFFDSKEGYSFQIAAYKFAKAFFEKNTKAMKSYLIDPDKGFIEYSLSYSFTNVEFMILKLNPMDIKKDSVSAQYEFKLDSEDSYTYLQLSMKKVDDYWKIESYGLEK